MTHASSDQMLYFVLGTKAEFIKMSPVIIEARKRGIPTRFIHTGQHPEGTGKLLEVFDVDDPDIWLRTGNDLASIGAMIPWFVRHMLRAVFRRKAVRAELFPKPGICCVHGDTVSTFLGTVLARRAGLKVAHVEAGLRSWSITQPFPEELIRILCMKTCHYLFAPNPLAVENLERMKVKGEIHAMGANTVADTLRLLGEHQPTHPIPETDFVLVSCHRFELIYSKPRLTWLLDNLERIAQSYPVYFALHEPTKLRVEKYGLWDRLNAIENLHLVPHMNYPDFIAWLRKAKFLVADGGSIQEETHYLGVPCLIVRDKTEREEGLGTTAHLAHFDDKEVTKFLEKVAQADSISAATHDARPANYIIDHLFPGIT